MRLLTKPPEPSHAIPNPPRAAGRVFTSSAATQAAGTETLNLGTEGQSLIGHRKVLQRLHSWTVWVLAGGARCVLRGSLEADTGSHNYQ